MNSLLCRIATQVVMAASFLAACAPTRAKSPGPTVAQTGAQPMDGAFATKAYSHARNAREPLGDVPLSDLGMIVGATYSTDLGRLFLIGTGRQREASPTLSQVALAFERVQGARVRPWVSIEPVPGALDGPLMNVEMSDDVVDTDFGWVMFEADRRLKSYALGYDNQTGNALTFGVKGFLNRIQLSHANQLAHNGGFQRFWLYPRSDGRAIDSPKQVRIESGGIRVGTEGLRAEGDRLVAEAQRKDPLADRFAEFVTTHFAELASEEPSFLRLEQLRRLMVVSEWARRHDIPVSLDWIAINARKRFPSPAQTKALRVAGHQSQTTTVHEGNATRVLETTTYLSALGGTSLQEFEPGFVVPRAAEPELIATETARAVLPNRARRYERGGEQFVALAIPLATNTNPRKLETLFSIPLGSSEVRLAMRIADESDRPAQSGVDRVLALPVLRAANPLDGREESLGVAGHSESIVLKRRYELYGADQAFLGSFTQHEIDQARLSVVVQDGTGRSHLRIYPLGTRKDGRGNPRPGAAAVVGWDDGGVRIFDVDSGALLREQFDHDLVDYVRAENGALQKVTMQRTGGAEQSLVEFEVDPGTNLVVSARRPGQKPIILARAAAEAVPAEFAKFGVRSEVARQAIVDASTCPALVAQGALTLLVHKQGVEPIAIATRNAPDLLTAVRERLSHASEAEIRETVVIDAQNDGAGGFGILMRSSAGEWVFDEIPENLPRRRLQGQAALDAYHALMAMLVQRAASEGHRFLYWARSGEALRVFVGTEVIEIPAATAQSNEALWIAIAAGPAPILLQQCLDLEPASLALAVTIRKRCLDQGQEVYLARDLLLALRNLKRNGQVKQPGEVALSVFPNFETARILENTAKRAAGSGLRFVAATELDTEPYLRGSVGERSVLVLYGHNDATLQEQLTKLGEEGKLRERTLLSVTCDEPNNGRRVSELIAASGAVGVTNSLVRVDPTLLNTVTAELGKVVKGLAHQPVSSDAILRNAIERALENPDNQGDHEQTEKLREMRDHLFFQISLRLRYDWSVSHA